MHGVLSLLCVCPCCSLFLECSLFICMDKSYLSMKVLLRYHPPSASSDPSSRLPSVPYAHINYSTLSIIQQAFVGLCSVPGANASWWKLTVSTPSQSQVVVEKQINHQEITEPHCDLGNSKGCGFLEEGSFSELAAECSRRASSLMKECGHGKSLKLVRRESSLRRRFSLWRELGRSQVRKGFASHIKYLDSILRTVRKPLKDLSRRFT